MQTFDDVLTLLRKCPVYNPGERLPGTPLDPATTAYLAARDKYDQENTVGWLAEVKKRMTTKKGMGCCGMLNK